MTLERILLWHLIVLLNRTHLLFIEPKDSIGLTEYYIWYHTASCLNNRIHPTISLTSLVKVNTLIQNIYGYSRWNSKTMKKIFVNFKHLNFATPYMAISQKVHPQAILLQIHCKFFRGLNLSGKKFVHFDIWKDKRKEKKYSKSLSNSRGFLRRHRIVTFRAADRYLSTRRG